MITQPPCNHYTSDNHQSLSADTNEMEMKMENWQQIVSGEYSMCFGCGHNNPIGLKLSFKWDGKTAKAEFTPTELYQGWSNVVHGGIITTMLDEAASWAILFEGMNPVTAKMEIRLRHPAVIDEPLIITASVTRKTKKRVEAKAAINSRDGTLIAESISTCFVIKPDEITNVNKAKAVIWDMDGVIADTAPYHFSAWQEVFRKRGVNFTEEDFRHSFGQRNDTIIRDTLGEDTSWAEINEISSEKEENFRRRIRQNLKPLPGVIKLITFLKQHRFKMALASSAPIENIQLLIKGLGINDRFQSITSDKDVTEGKPNPQVFLLAAQKLEVKPKNCVVIEDAVAGVTAAKRAGMYCLAITNTHPRTSLLEADFIVDTLEEVTVNDLERLLSPS